MGWRTIYIEECNSISLYLDNLKVHDVKGDILIPIKDIDTIIIDNYKTIISTQLLSKCSEYNINFVICNVNHLPISQMVSFSGNCLSSKMLKEQLSWDENLKGNLWKDIVYYKIKNQIAVLQENNKLNDVKEMIENLHNSIIFNDQTNREGLVAKIYFRSLFGNRFRRFKDDVINSGLNYGYTILRAMIARSIISKGLNPMLGLFHKSDSNTFNLADDFIEVFRPIIDSYVYQNLNDSSILFTRQHRLDIVKLLTKKIEINGKKQTISNAIDIYIDSVINYFETGSLVLFPSIKLYDV